MNLEDLVLDVNQEIEINAPVDEVFSGLIHRLTDENGLGGTPMPMVMEQWPGGRWYRDLGDNAGHLWGHVQVIKPPGLLEIHGPLFMSYAAAGHLQLRLTPTDDGGTRLQLRHCAIGMVQGDHRKGVVAGWDSLLQSVKSRCE